MRHIVSIVCVALLMGLIGLAQAQEGQKKAPEGQPQGQPGQGGGRGGGGGGFMDPELRQKFQELRDIEQKLEAAEAKARETDPDLKKLHDKIQTSIEELASTLREYDQKTDDLVVKASPDLAQSVTEKRAILEELEAKMGERASGFWLMRMGRAFGIGFGRGGRPGGPGGAGGPGGPAPGGPANPPPAPAK